MLVCRVEADPLWRIGKSELPSSSGPVVRLNGHSWGLPFAGPTNTGPAEVLHDSRT
jgi:hypothetical protein